MIIACLLNICYIIIFHAQNLEHPKNYTNDNLMTRNLVSNQDNIQSNNKTLTHLTADMNYFDICVVPNL